MEDDPLAAFAPEVTPVTRVVGLLLRVWSRVVSPAGTRLITPALAAAVVFALWQLWRLTGASALGRAVRWHAVFVLTAATSGLAVYLLAAPPEDPTDAAAARAFAAEGVGRPVYPELLVVAGAIVVCVTTFAALRAAWRSSTAASDRRDAIDAWGRLRAREGRRAARFVAAVVGGTFAVAAALIAAGSVGRVALPEHPRGAGALWVGTPSGAARLTPDGWVSYRRPWSPLPAAAVHDIAAGPGGEVWLATSGGLLRIGADGSYLSSMVENAPLPYPTVLGVSIDRRGVAWAATVAGAAAVDQKRDGRAFSGRTAPLMHQLLDAAHVDRRGHVWFGGAGGVNVYEPAADWSEPGRWPAGFNRWSTNEGLPESLVFTIFEDRVGRMWFGTDGGAAAFTPDPTAYALGSGETPRWQTLTTASSGLVHDKVHAIVQDSAGRMWFGTERGISIYDEGASGAARWTTIDAGRLPHPHVEALAVSPDGRVWIGTKGGLTVVDPRGSAMNLPVYRSHPLRHWTGLLWPPHSRLDLPADEISSLVWVP
jgi:hypothetical protein